MLFWPLINSVGRFSVVLAMDRCLEPKFLSLPTAIPSLAVKVMFSMETVRGRQGPSEIVSDKTTSREPHHLVRYQSGNAKFFIGFS